MQPKIVQSLSSLLPYCSLVNVGAKHSLTVIKIKVFLCLDVALRSHVIASHCLRLFQPPRSKTKPTLPDLACSCIGVSQSQPSTYRIALSKSKNPARCSVVLALGESNSKAIECVQKTRLPYDKTTQYPAGFTNTFIA